MLLVGLSQAGQTDATDAASRTGVLSSLLCTAKVDVSDGFPSNSDLAGAAKSGQTAVNLLNLVWADSTAAPAPGRYWCPGTGIYRDTLWFLGGRMSAQTSTRSMTAYDITSGTWIDTDLPKLTTPRRAGGGGRIGSKIYIAGGRDSLSDTLYTCEEFDLDTKTFTPKADMPAAYWAVASAVAGDKLYIIGNELGTGTTYEYNPVVDSWKTKATLSVSRGWAGAAGANGLVYVMGGSAAATVYSDCWCFDPAANTWTQKANMPGPRTYSAATAYKDSLIFVIGGCTAASATPADKLVYEYDIVSNTWKTDTPKPTASGWHMVNAAADAIYVAYGSDTNTPTYLTNLNVGWLVAPGVEVIDPTQPEAVCHISPSVVRGFASISYSAARAGRAELGIYDVTGKLVRTLVDGTVKPGSQSATWNRTDNSGKRVANGTYFYRLSVDGKSASGKAIVLK
jgi:N-acetylneuraminic acid mutarotase